VTAAVRAALRGALSDLYRNSWRFVLANGCLAASVLVPVWLAIELAAPAPLLLLVLAGPACAGLVHCAVSAVDDSVHGSGDVRAADMGHGVRRHWRRGLALGALLGLVVVAGVSAIRVYAGRGGVWTVAAFGCGYLLAVAVLFQLVLWPAAIRLADRRLAEAFRAAAAQFAYRWSAVLRLGAVLFVVNLAGAVAVLPLLTVTVAFSFLAAARLLAPAGEPVTAALSKGESWPA
jgi:hypothetical protein